MPTPNLPVWLNRGYTGHEMLNEVGLIHMNARLYDPFIARMLSPDNVISAPGYSQNYNRYSYAYNNPLKYIDPDDD
jgi:RHS repeat-associated protein